jgi:hypothetical protein
VPFRKNAASRVAYRPVVPSLKSGLAVILHCDGTSMNEAGPGGESTLIPRVRRSLLTNGGAMNVKSMSRCRCRTGISHRDDPSRVTSRAHGSIVLRLGASGPEFGFLPVSRPPARRAGRDSPTRLQASLRAAMRPCRAFCPEPLSFSCVCPKPRSGPWHRCRERLRTMGRRCRRRFHRPSAEWRWVLGAASRPRRPTRGWPARDESRTPGCCG